MKHDGLIGRDGGWVSGCLGEDGEEGSLLADGIWAEDWVKWGAGTSKHLPGESSWQRGGQVQVPAIGVPVACLGTVRRSLWLRDPEWWGMGVGDSQEVRSGGRQGQLTVGFKGFNSTQEGKMVGGFETTDIVWFMMNETNEKDPGTVLRKLKIYYSEFYYANIHSHFY